MIVKNYILIFLLNTCKKGKKTIDIKIRLIIIFSSAQQNDSVSLRQSKILFFRRFFFLFYSIWSSSEHTKIHTKNYIRSKKKKKTRYRKINSFLL